MRRRCRPSCASSTSPPAPCAATVPLEGEPGGPVLAPDGQFVYLLDRGRPNNNPDKNVNGRLPPRRWRPGGRRASPRSGSKPRGLVLDERGQQLLLPSDGPPVKGPANRDRPGELRIIRGAAPAPIAVGTGARTARGQRRRPALSTSSGPIASRAWRCRPRPAAPPTFKVFGEELRVSPDGSRLYMVNGEYFWTFDSATGTRLAEVRTGRMGKKMFRPSSPACRPRPRGSTPRTRPAARAGRTTATPIALADRTARDDGGPGRTARLSTC